MYEPGWRLRGDQNVRTPQTASVFLRDIDLLVRDDFDEFAGIVWILDLLNRRGVEPGLDRPAHFRGVKIQLGDDAAIAEELS